MRFLRVYVIDDSIDQKYESEKTKRTLELFYGQRPKDLNVEIYSFVPKYVPEYNADYAAVREALKDSRDKDHHDGVESYVIVCKVNTISVSNSTNILFLLNQVIGMDCEKEKTFDIFYLCSWLNNCSDFKNKTDLEGRGVFMVDVFQPRGFQCAMFSPSFVEKFRHMKPASNKITFAEFIRLNINSRNVKNCDKGFIATTSYPPLLSYDISKSECDEDFMKANMCLPDLEIHHKKCENEKKDDCWYTWGIIIIIILIIIVFFVWFAFYWSNETKRDPFLSPCNMYKA